MLSRDEGWCVLSSWLSLCLSKTNKCHHFFPFSGMSSLHSSQWAFSSVLSFCPVKAGMRDLFSLFFSFSSFLSTFFSFSLFPSFFFFSEQHVCTPLCLPPEHQYLPEGSFYMSAASVFIFDNLVTSTAIQGVSLDCLTLEARGFLSGSYV